MDRIENPVAERELVFTKKTGESFLCKILIGKPHKDAENYCYKCAYQIVGIGDEKIRYMQGVDSFQTISLTLEIVPTWLEVNSKDHDGDYTLSEIHY